VPGRVQTARLEVGRIAVALQHAEELASDVAAAIEAESVIGIEEVAARAAR